MHFRKLKLILEQILFSSHVFLLVLLLAENRLLIPDWLHVVGRLHPVLLHFPIVLLLLAITIVIFPNLLKNKEDQAYYGQMLFLIGCVLTALTVIAGFFLALEDAATTLAMQRHKWTGLAVFWGASLFYWFFPRLSRFPVTQKYLAGFLSLLIVITGHLGASLVHGENFITAPLSKSSTQLVSLSEAKVFDHVIMPILDNKCISCHKASRNKGGLRLDQAEHIIKGGESGPALVPGDLEKSLLAYRIMLSEDHEDHMPPKEKPQLSEEEKEIIISWIKSGGDIDKKLADYDSEEPIFQLTSQRFEDVPKTYTFRTASAGTIKSLNNPYRRVSPLSPGSPALTVSYFGQNNFDVASLQELSAINEQIVFLNLNHMPIEDKDMEPLTSFPNLETLHLNFTNVQGQGIESLAGLKNLTVLSLTGNQLSEDGLTALTKLRGLENLYLWNTGLEKKQVSALQESLPNCQIEMGYVDDGTIYQLNPPALKFDKAFFEDHVKVEMSHSIKSVSIYYTLDGSLPDSSNFTLYEGPIEIDSNMVVKARAFAEGWTGSIEVGSEFIRSSVRPNAYFLRHPPHDRYKGGLVNSLFDGQKAVADVWDLNWLGFIHTPLDVEMEFEGSRDINSVELSIWGNNGARFFPPENVEIWVFKEDEWEMVSSLRPTQPKQEEPSGLKRVKLPFQISDVTKIRLIAHPVSSLPSWHGGAGQQAWLMIDELIIN